MAKCIFCGGKADLLCDSWLGWERKRGQMEVEAPNLLMIRSTAVPIRYRHVHTCDAPLCRACAVSAGHMFIRLRNGPHLVETTDYCPGHGRGNRRAEITGLEAEAMRKAWRAQALTRRDGSPAHQVDWINTMNAGTAGESKTA